MSNLGASAINVRSLTQGSHCVVALSEMVLEIDTSEPIQFIDLTDQVNDYLREIGMHDGNVVIFSRHTTAAIRINEAEELLLQDFKRMLQRICPPEHDYDHNDMSRRKPPIAPDERPNAHSHCMHLLLSTSETVPVVNSKLALGTWQRLFLVELDGPRHREVSLRFVNYVQPESVDRKLVAKPANGNGNGRRTVIA